MEAREIAAAVHEEQVNVALGELEAELIKVVRVELAEGIAARKTPPKTLASYKKHLAAFRAWCEGYPVPLPHRPPAPQAVAAFLAHMASSGATLGEVRRAAEAISYPSRLADLSDPGRDVLVGAVLRYLSKTISPAAKPLQPKKKEK
jgi:hypothetical protein